jgi:glucose/arabinose dehydrogenase
VTTACSGVTNVAPEAGSGRYDVAMRRTALLALIAACGDNRVVGEPVITDGNAAACTPTYGTNILIRQVAMIHGAVMLVTGPPGDPRQFVVEQTGRIWIIENGALLPRPFLDFSADGPGPITCCGERGLLGLAFHPDYATNGTFFVFYTAVGTPPVAGADVIARYQRHRDDPNRADPTTGTIVLSIPDFAGNHNGGMIDFGRDGYLYIGTGDGGGGGDPFDNGQNMFALLGKMLRIDVDHPTADKRYGIPPDNPFADGVAGAPEVYMSGLRNPWRWSIDRGTGDIWIGDVGQDMYEELDYAAAGAQAGANFGWSSWEAEACFKPPCMTTLQPAVDIRSHAGDGWCSAIGGDVYRGACYPDLVGTYFYTDYCRHTLERATATAGVPRLLGPAQVETIDLGAPQRPGFPFTPASIHSDGRGELYVTTVSCCGSSFLGGVYHLEVAR